jgi:predicted dehydrogenase
MTALVQVGLGSWGLDWARNVLPEIPEAELVACVDSRPEALKAACESGVITARQCYSSVADAIKDRTIDAVLITTDGSHGDIVRSALRAEKHVLVEKPFVGSVSEARELADEAAARDCTLMVSQNYRFFPAVRAARELVKSQQLGQLHHVAVDFRRLGGGAGKHVRWRHPLLLDMGIHHFDLMRAVLCREPRAVDCRGWNPSWAGFRDPPAATAIVDFENGVTVSYRGSWLVPEQPTAWAGEWVMEFEQGTVMWTSRGDRSGVRSAEGDAVTVHRPRSAPERIALPHMELMDRAGALDAFTRALASGTTPESAAAENVGSVALACAAIESADCGEPVPVATFPNPR